MALIFMFPVNVTELTRPHHNQRRNFDFNQPAGAVQPLLIAYTVKLINESISISKDDWTYFDIVWKNNWLSDFSLSVFVSSVFISKASLDP